ncbi:putative drug efflux protein [Yersinia enterocolitica]|uniref:efflux RND transporter periplasmic adaptor subunit n=1 Tax=Yersinia enterocolitica TaxID=630 RepID=UPI0002819883|nr:efflux RND transporter periplasmic adaptor subunit [Yersinia enterocolitica]AJI82731.1 efflux transporter, RND family, MFP subunit [Yersinia enterocolitica]EKA26409.1 putative drug efflux protein [Yersinia enterocolitica subsp. enterocolitica WA-314]ELI8281560.1 efflux RND transporter periplasmic adaptor subunit [Yersinia enterocolitica]KGA69276.1 efflux transporter, RND family, MFP subunit [Yersinia enterocolitica]KGA76072.1 efflux transporter, RND family, MFP subunit [Yersinia enterocolit
MSTLNWVRDTIMLNVQRALCARRDYLPVYAAVLILSIGSQSVMAATPLPAVTVAVVTSATPDSALQFLGRVEAIQAVDVTTRTEGFIAARLFTEGQMVKQGDLLYEIDPALHQASVTQAQAQLDSATASANHAQVNLTRLQRLGNNRSVSQAEVDEAQAQRDISRAAVAQAQANLQIQQLQLSFTHIYAPITGQIGHSRFNVGSLINPASGTLVSIVQLDPIRVAIAVNERDYITATYQLSTTGVASASDNSALVFEHFTPRIQLANGKQYPESGVFESVDNQIDKQTGTVTIRTRFDNPRHLLLPGGVVNVSLAAETAKAVTAIPIAALQQNKQGHFVLVVTDKDQVEVRPVTLGEQFEQQYEVKDGLKVGERVIVSGLQHVRPGMTVSASIATPLTAN